MHGPRISTIVFLALLVPATLQAGPPPPSRPSSGDRQAVGLTSYETIREALSRDSLEGIAAAASSLERELRSVTGPAKDAASEVSRATKRLAAESSSLDKAREAFKPLSEAYIRYLEKSHATGELVRFHCPMAKADWIQANRKAANPYFGSSMSGCGEVVPWKQEK
jgi:Cu(I)/Ag(I) efflux system membrane fusion protein